MYAKPDQHWRSKYSNRAVTLTTLIEHSQEIQSFSAMENSRYRHAMKCISIQGLIYLLAIVCEHYI